MGARYDFSGWATKNDLRCSDGRTIRRDAFKDDDGRKVPLVWNHQHNEPENVLGHAMLENRPEGVYAYCTFNDTEKADTARRLVAHGDIFGLSIYANQLKQQGGNVMHGIIREVSLVLAGANPEAMIDTVLAHGIDSDEEGIIFTGEKLNAESGELKHAAFKPDEKSEKKEEPTMAEAKKPPVEETETDDSEETVADVFNTLTDKQKKVVYALIGQALEDAKKKGSIKHAATEEDEEDEEEDEEEDDESDGEETVADVFNTLTAKQKKVVYALIGQALEDAKKNKGGDAAEGDSSMKHNVFDSTPEDDELIHTAMTDIITDARRSGSLKDSFLAHAGDYGIENLEYLFPDDRTLNKAPEFIKRPDSWVSAVMNAVSHTPFSRVKSIFADITEADARAKGYIKGNRKTEEVFALLKRSTTPTTVYKKQKMDRDDQIDITDFDIVSWLKTEMRLMLDEELARAYLLGDGRSPASDDKISEEHIRPIWKDDDLFVVRKAIATSADTTEDQRAKAFIKAAVKARKDYRGSGNPTLYTTEDMLTDMLLLEDNQGHVLYDSEEKLCTALRVKNIVPVSPMEGASRVSGTSTMNLLGIIVNLADYTVGADKGGAINMFDDFDIDFNQQKYLIETRCSGALTKPYSAIVIESSESMYLDIDAEDDDDHCYGKSVDDLSSGLVVNDDHIQGTLKYVTGYTGFSGDPAEQSGNYLALKFDAPAGATTTVELLGGTVGHPVELDSDMSCVFRIGNRNQKIRVISTKDDLTITKVLSLRTLKLASAN